MKLTFEKKKICWWVLRDKTYIGYITETKLWAGSEDTRLTLSELQQIVKFMEDMG